MGNLIKYNTEKAIWECQKCDKKTTSQDVNNLIQHAIKKQNKAIPDKLKQIKTTTEQIQLINTRIKTLLLETNKKTENNEQKIKNQQTTRKPQKQTTIWEKSKWYNK